MSTLFAESMGKNCSYWKPFLVNECPVLTDGSRASRCSYTRGIVHEIAFRFEVEPKIRRTAASS